MRITDVLSSRLRAALGKISDPQQNDEAIVEAIASDRGLVDEAVQALPALNAIARQPVTENGLKMVIAQRFSIYPPQERTEEEWSNYWAQFVDACGDLPEAAIEAGMRAWVKRPESRFMPSPGELRTLALTVPVQAARDHALLRKAIGLAQEKAAMRSRQEFVLTPPETKHPPPTAEERSSVRAQLDRFLGEFAQGFEARRRLEAVGRFDVVFRNHMVGGTPEYRAELQALWDSTLASVKAGEAAPRSTRAFREPIVDQGGVTEAMRDVLERQYGTRYPAGPGPRVEPEVAAELLGDAP